MAAPVYKQAEIERLLAVKKRATDSAWPALRPADWGPARRRANVYERVAQITVLPWDDSSVYKFSLEICHNTRTDHVAITLRAAIPPRPMLPVCRYEVRDAPHANPACCPGQGIESGTFRRHVYNEQAVREGDPESWDACAEALDLSSSGTGEAQMRRLANRTLGDLNIAFDDPAVDTLFRTGRP